MRCLKEADRPSQLAGYLYLCHARELLGAWSWCHRGTFSPKHFEKLNNLRDCKVRGLYTQYPQFGKENGWMDWAYVPWISICLHPWSSRLNTGMQAVSAFLFAVLDNGSCSMPDYSCSGIVFERFWLLAKHWVNARKHQCAAFLSDASLRAYVPLGLGSGRIFLSILGENNSCDSHQYFYWFFFINKQR